MSEPICALCPNTCNLQPISSIALQAWKSYDQNIPRDAMICGDCLVLLARFKVHVDSAQFLAGLPAPGKCCFCFIGAPHRLKGLADIFNSKKNYLIGFIQSNYQFPLANDSLVCKHCTAKLEEFYGHWSRYKQSKGDGGMAQQFSQFSITEASLD